MSYRSILAPLDGHSDNAAILGSALLIARTFDAQVDALHVRPDPRDIAPMFGEGMSGEMMEEMISAAERMAGENARAVKATFDATVSSGDAAHWIEREGREDEHVAWLGRLADLIVTARAAEDGPPMRPLTIHAALFESGRPVLVLPPRPQVKELGRAIAIAWNGTAQSARAVQGAMPLITRASEIHVLTCESTRTDLSAADELADYLSRWAVTAEVHAFPPLEGDVGNAILFEAARFGADLLVSGAYSHARLMQAILGGVTTALMDDAKLPILFSH